MTANTKELVEVNEQQEKSVSIFDNEKKFAFAQRAATALASSELVPERYQKARFGDQAVSNAMIAMDMAHRVGMSPLMVMQNLYVVYGNPGWSAQYIRAAINSSGKFTIPQYEFFGEEGTDTYGCKCYATYLANGEKIFGPKAHVKMAKAEGWWQKKGSKWPNMTDLMLQNRAVTFFGRTYCPEVLMGMQSSDELNDVIDVNPKPSHKPMTKNDIEEALVGEVVEEQTVAKKEPQKQKEDPKQGPEKKPEKKKQDKPAAKKDDGNTEFTVERLMFSIEKAESIDVVNDALSCTKGFSKDDQNKVLRAASKKNKELAEAVTRY